MLKIVYLLFNNIIMYKEILNNIDFPIAVVEDRFDQIFTNRYFDRFCIESRIDPEDIFNKIKLNFSYSTNQFREFIDKDNLRYQICARRDNKKIVIFIEYIRDSYIDNIRKKIINNFSKNISSIFSNLLKIGTKQLKKIEKNRYSSMLIEIMDQMDSVVDAMESYSNRVTGYKDYQIFSINDVIDKAIIKTKPLWEGRAKLKNINYDIVLTKGKNCFIKGNLEQLVLAFVQIIKNSIEAMEKGGKVEINFDIVRKNRVEIVFKDYGVGISGVKSFYIFEPFYTTKKGGHKGLGLTQAYGIIKKHNGIIDVNINIRKGVELTITLPTYKKREFDNFKEVK